jgi:hypothetical protein
MPTNRAISFDDAATAAQRKDYPMTTSNQQEKIQRTSAKAITKARLAKRRAHAASEAEPVRKATGAKKPPAARHGSKTAKILDLLKRPSGVTLKELTKATGWQAHSVRGFLSGTVGKKLGTPVASTKRADGERSYHLSK